MNDMINALIPQRNKWAMLCRILGHNPETTPAATISDMIAALKLENDRIVAEYDKLDTEMNEFIERLKNHIPDEVMKLAVDPIIGFVPEDIERAIHILCNSASQAEKARPTKFNKLMCDPAFRAAYAAKWAKLASKELELDFDPDAQHSLADMANIGYEFMCIVEAGNEFYNTSPVELFVKARNERDVALAALSIAREGYYSAEQVEKAVLQAQVDAADGELSYFAGRVLARLAQEVSK